MLLLFGEPHERWEELGKILKDITKCDIVIIDLPSCIVAKVWCMLSLDTWQQCLNLHNVMKRCQTEQRHDPLSAPWSICCTAALSDETREHGPIHRV